MTESTNGSGLQLGQSVPNFELATYDPVKNDFGTVSLDQIKSDGKWHPDQHEHERSARAFTANRAASSVTAGMSLVRNAATAATCIAVGMTSFEDWLLLTSSLG